MTGRIYWTSAFGSQNGSSDVRREFRLVVDNSELSGNYREMGFEPISLLRIATDAARLLGRQTLPQSVSICFENK
jgi:hypothetical protein